MSDVDSKQDAPAPESSPGKKDEKPERTYTKDEVERRLQGQGKVIEELQTKLKAHDDADAKRKQDAAEAKRKQLEDEGKYKELLEEAKRTITGLTTELNDRKTSETARLERVTAENAKRIEKLPKHFRELVPEGLDPDTASVQIAKLEAMAAKPETRDVHGGGGRQEGRNPEQLFQPITGWHSRKAGGK